MKPAIITGGAVAAAVGAALLFGITAGPARTWDGYCGSHEQPVPCETTPTTPTTTTTPTVPEVPTTPTTTTAPVTTTAPATTPTPTVPEVVPTVRLPREVNFTFKKVGPAHIHGGGTAVYKFQFRNRSTRTTLRDVRIVDPLPASLSVVTMPPGATLVNGRLDFSFTIVPPGVTRTRFVTLRAANVRGPVCNTASGTVEGKTRYDRTCAVVRRVEGAFREGGVAG